MQSAGVDLVNHDSEKMFITRSYQQEMLDESLRHNIIVAMDTGSGKTHIAVLRIKAELEKCSPEKVVWFTTPSVALCYQQYDVLRKSIPAFQCRVLCSDDDVDHWSTQAIWDAALKNIRIVTSTPKVLLDALSHGFVSLSRIALLVFDEAHHCVKKSVQNQIMQCFYHPLLHSDGPQSVPHILGLTASPVMNGKSQGLEIIEHNMNALSKTPKFYRSELASFVSRPQVQRIIPSIAVISQDIRPCTVALKERLHNLLRTYDFDQDPYIRNMRSEGDPGSIARADRTVATRSAWCYVEIKRLCDKAFLAPGSILSTLGWWVFDWYVRKCIEKFCGNLKSEESRLPGWMPSEKQHLSMILRSVCPDYSAAFEEPALQSDISSKAHQLIDLLIKELNPGFRAIIFAEQRATVACLNQLLSAHPKTKGILSFAAFVGTSSYSEKKRSICELADIKGQQNVLEKFRLGEVNVLVATSVAEEGIDVPACNTVICFDPPKNLIQFIQRRGRARMMASKYIIFQADGDITDGWASLEEEMRAAYLDEERQLQAERAIEEIEEFGERFMRIESTGALLTLDNAVSHLYHFCQSVSRSALVDLRPEFAYESVPKPNPFSAAPDILLLAKVNLPLAVDISVRYAQAAELWMTEKNARKDAAFVACAALYQKGLLSDHLLPFLEIKERSAAPVVRQASMATVASRIDPWNSIAQRWQSSRKYYSTAITLRSSEGETVKARMLLPVIPPSVHSYELYWDSQMTFLVESENCTTELIFDQHPTDELLIARKSTYVLLSSVMPKRTREDTFDFVALFVPSEVSTKSENWNISMAGKIPIEEARTKGLLLNQTGLVTDTTRYDALHFFDSLVMGYPTKKYDSMSDNDAHARKRRFPALDQDAVGLQGITRVNAAEDIPEDGGAKDEELCVKAIKVPRRSDFLHKINTNGKPAVRFLVPKDCYINKLPKKDSIFALCIPSILHRYEIYFVAEELRSAVLQPIGFNNLDLVLTAICASFARENSNYQVLEFVGDCILKLLCSLHLFLVQPFWHENFLTVEKSRIVSNSSLASIAIEFGLDRFIITSSFTGRKWRPKHIKELLDQAHVDTRDISTKVLADVVEALIGASFMDQDLKQVKEPLEKPLRCLKLFYSKYEWRALEDLETALYSQNVDLRSKASYLDDIEDLMGYRFHNRSMLIESLTHISFRGSTTAVPYDRLEFLGDPILDYLVVTKLLECGKQLQHYRMHTIRTALVNADFLAFLCMELRIAQERSDIARDETTAHFTATTGHAHHFLWQFMRHSSIEVTKAQHTACELHERFNEEISSALSSGERYPWGALASTNASKFFSDIIESTLAAIYIDSKGSMQVCLAFLEKLGLMTHLRRFLHDEVHLLHPKEELGQLANTESVRYEVQHSKELGFTCEAYVGDRLVAAVSHGLSKFEVEVRSAEEAVLAWAPPVDAQCP